MGAIAQGVQSSAIGIDDMNRGLPVGDLFVIFQSAKEDEHVARLGP